MNFKESPLATEQTKSAKKHLSLILRILIAIFACWFLYSKIDPDQVAQAFTQLRISTLLLAILCFCIGLCLIGFRWWVFMRAQKIYVPVLLAIKLTFLGQFFTNFMPSAVGGDLVRAWYISQHTDKRLQAAIGVAADRFMGLAGTMILAFSSYMLFMRGEEGFFQIDKKENPLKTFIQEHQIPGYWFLVGGIVLLGIIFLLAKLFDLKKFFKKLRDIIIHLFQQTSQVFLIYVHHPLILLFGLAISIFMQMLVISSFWLIGRDLDIQAQIHYYFVFFPMMWIIGSLPLSIAGIGILEGGLVLLFVQFTGASAESVMAMALCQRLAWILGSLPGLVVHLTGAHRAKDSEC
ncbi:MAG: lysylphosphatidylglycerol synthase transmembrane domain-containing protein [Planctomycetota bacterium]